ncbi:hypothetical protein N5J66_13735 [Pseudomonas juntendi]|uniref:Lipoprotein n=1 Tax=Pseudomonas monteilii TaxID=76759 RepID=A0A7X3JTM2_9PSED|nr:MULTISPECIES: hypothetical protein [Pseudomonas]MDH2015023.1 hypothetical protein [Pseudomonas juntendi]MVF51773.1 hypothetical protein [Pseudomonas monteilii]
MRFATLLIPITFLASCGMMSIDQMRDTLPAKIYTSELSPDALNECIVGVFNGDARGFEMIRFDGAKSYRQGNRITITAITGYPMYFLDITPNDKDSKRSLIQERSLEHMPIGYLDRFQGLTRSCLR